MINKKRVLTAMRLAQIMKDSSKHGERFCFVLGAGASKESGIKTGIEMACEWGKYIEEHQDEFGEDAVDSLKKDLELDNLVKAESKHYFDIYDFRWNGEPQNGYHFIQNSIENILPSYGYYPLAMLLAKTKNNLVITTNFDNLAEDALSASTDARSLVIGHESLTTYVDLNQTRPIIAKLHRDLFLKPLSSQEDTDGLKDGWEGALTKAFGIYMPVVIGYAGGDGSLMEYLKKETTLLRGLYWCYRKGDEPSEEIQQLVSAKNGWFVEINGFDSAMCLIGNKFEYNSPATEIRGYMVARAETLIKNYEERRKQLMDEFNTASAPNQEASTVKAVLKNEKDRQKEILDERIAKNPMDAEAFFERGDLHYYERDYEEAVADYTKSLDLAPGRDMGYFKRGVSYTNIGKQDLAIKDFSESLKLSPNPSTHYLRGNSHFELGNFDDALGDFTIAINLSPNVKYYYIGRAEAYDALGQHDKAVADRAKADKLNNIK